MRGLGKVEKQTSVDGRCHGTLGPLVPLIGAVKFVEVVRLMPVDLREQITAFDLLTTSERILLV